VKLPEDSRCVIVGAARNVENDIERTYLRLSQAFSCFNSLEFLIIESFSTDNTAKVLERLTTKYENFSFESITDLDFTLTSRTERIASARNYALSRLKSRSSKIDYVAVADLDGVNKHLTLNSVKSCWDFQDWDAIFANQQGFYYDIWALRHPNWSPNDCWRDYENMIPLIGRRNAFQLSVKSRMIELKSDTLVKVDSAFGGLGIYRSKAFFSSKYLGVTEGKEICEHVPFNLYLTQNDFKLFINPRLVNLKRRKISSLVANIMSYKYYLHP
jgi:glycosyltransferase involved in cell wall biosynthesis